jgi:hypothetical protein
MRFGSVLTNKFEIWFELFSKEKKNLNISNNLGKYDSLFNVNCT